MTNDFATVAYRIKLLGFNTIRVPFRWVYRQGLMSTAQGCQFACLDISSIETHGGEEDGWMSPAVYVSSFSIVVTGVYSALW